MIGIYKITSPKGKIYIGQSRDIETRFYDYRRLHCEQQVRLYRSFIKYGVNNHSFEVVEECEFELLNERERYWQDYYNVLCKYKGLNCSLVETKHKPKVISEETRKKIGSYHKGKKLSKEHKELISINTRNYLKNNPHPMLGKNPWNKGKSFLKGKNNPMYGVKRSKEWRENHSERMKKINKSGLEHSKTNIILDLDTGVFYYGYKDLAYILNIKYSTLRGLFSKGNKSFKNFIIT